MELQEMVDGLLTELRELELPGYVEPVQRSTGAEVYTLTWHGIGKFLRASVRWDGRTSCKLIEDGWKGATLARGFSWACVCLQVKDLFSEMQLISKCVADDEDVSYDPVSSEALEVLLKPNDGPGGGSATACDLSDRDFSGKRLRGYTFTRCDFRKSVFAEADLTGTVFNECRLEGASFNGALMGKCAIADCALDGATELDSVSELWGARFQKEVFPLLASGQLDPVTPVSLITGKDLLGISYGASIGHISDMIGRIDGPQNKSNVPARLEQSEILVLKKLVAVFEAFSAKDGGVS